MNKRYQIFISSTYEDLKEERKKVIQAILKLYHFPIGMEMFHADNEEQWEQIKNTLDMSDYYILILGRCCGTLIEKEGISYTEKEYNYAISKGIPVLAFIISEDAKKESYGIESNKQQNAYKKFVKKVKQLPCEFWHTPEELAYQVATTLSIKFKENNRRGWIPHSDIDYNNTNLEYKEIEGEYLLYYYSYSKNNMSRVESILRIENNGKVTLLNNIKRKNTSIAEYQYNGFCDIKGNTIYIILNNRHFGERGFISLIKPVVGNHRYIGLFSALTSDGNPVCVKVACIRKEIVDDGINFKVLDRCLLNQNISYNNNSYIIDINERTLFFSDNLYIT